MRKVELLVIGGGSAGMAAALSAYENGIKDILIVERENELGGILQQCIHNGFGLHTFKEELSGPQFAQRFINRLKETDIQVMLDTTVLKVNSDKTVEISSAKGIEKIQAAAIILAMGCRERTASEIRLKGSRPKGIYNAGSAQLYLNKDGKMVGKKVFILGSGDIGLIMARRMVWEGAQVLGVAEIMPYSNGLARNIQQCLIDYDIPLYLSHTVTKVCGYPNLQQIEIAQVDENRKIIQNTQKCFDVDTLLLSVGLIPENRIIEDLLLQLNPKTRGVSVDEDYMSEVEGIFACGNVLHVHDLVDYVADEAIMSGKAAAEYLQGKRNKKLYLEQQAGKGLNYILPQRVHADSRNDVEFKFRVTQPIDRAILKITSNGFEKRISLRNVVPAEMKKAVLKADELASCHEAIKWEVVYD